jgi:hypothetical protein
MNTRIDKLVNGWLAIDDSWIDNWMARWMGK